MDADDAVVAPTTVARLAHVGHDAVARGSTWVGRRSAGASRVDQRQGVQSRLRQHDRAPSAR